MASQLITLHQNATEEQVFQLVGVLPDGARYMISGRPIACPFVIEIKRKLNPNGSGNDHVGVRIARTEQNATTGKLATCQFLLDLSIPKDQSILTQVVQKQIGSLLSSMFNDGGAMVATSANLSALIEGRDL